MVKAKGKGKAPALKGRGKGRGRQSPPPPPSPTLSSTSDHDEIETQEETQDTQASQQVQGQEVQEVGSSGDSPKKKKSKKTTYMTVEEEEIMVAWIYDNECLYNKKLNAYKDVQKKKKMLEDQAKEMAKDSEMLHIWYRSLRTRYVRLLKKKSGDGAAELTERDEWILSNFSFLRTHIYDVRKRTVVSIKAKVAAATGIAVDITDDEVQEALTPTTGTSTETPVLDVMPRNSAANMLADEEKILTGIEERRQQSAELQEKIMHMLQPAHKVTERTTYADWTKSVMEDLDPSLWRRFQLEHSQLLYKYLEMNDDITARSAAHQSFHDPPRQHQTASQHHPATFQQYQDQSPSSTKWQPARAYWPSTVQSGTSVWGSQPTEWTQGQTQPTLQYMAKSTPMMTQGRGGGGLINSQLSYFQHSYAGILF